MSIVEVQNAIYENFFSPSNGGVFSVQKVILSIRGCYFCNCSNPSYGGAVYADNCVSCVKNTVFDKCYVSSFINDYWGNSIHITKGKIEIDEISTYMCGLPNKKCGDSAISCQSLAYLTYINSTYNYGAGGGSLASLLNANSGSYLKYCNCYEPRDIRTVETNYIVITIENTNFINCSQLEEALFYSETHQQFVLSYCVVWDLGNKILSYYQISVQNCLSNTLTQTGFTPISTITTFQNQINIKLNLKNKCVTVNPYKYLTMYKSSVFIFILALIN